MHSNDNNQDRASRLIFKGDPYVNDSSEQKIHSVESRWDHHIPAGIFSWGIKQSRNLYIRAGKVLHKVWIRKLLVVILRDETLQDYNWVLKRNIYIVRQSYL